jgi:predicted nucleic-acid-binding Zn-ribbon protein
MDNLGPCPSCRGNTLYRGPATSAGGGEAPNYLPGLGKLFSRAKFVLVVCRDCGLARFFVEPEARARLAESGKWKAV